MKDYSDYFAISWQKSRPVPGFWRFLVRTIVIWLPLVVGYVVVVWYVAYHQRQMEPAIVLYTLLPGGGFFFWLFMILAYIIVKAKGVTLVKYRIDREGVLINEHQLSYDELDTQNLLSLVSQQESSNDAVLILGRRRVLWKHELRFSDIENKRQVLKSLKHYLEDR